ASIDDFARFTANAPQAADLVLDLCGAGRRPGERAWQLTFDTTPSESTAIGALICGRAPVVAIIDLETGAEVISSRRGSENNHIILLAFEDLLARTGTLVTAALDGASGGHCGDAVPAVAASTRATVAFATRSLANAAARRLYLLCYYAPHWRVGWRW